MRALVVYESMYGNSGEIAHAIAEGVGGETRVTAVPDAGTPGAELELTGRRRPDAHARPRNVAEPADDGGGGQGGRPSTRSIRAEESGLPAWLRERVR